jgi:uncharacterized protein
LRKIKALKLFNDPIYGFITISNPIIFDLIEHPYFQRLRRISQMGLSYLVYTGAHHTRFHHAIGCMHIMQKTVQVLRSKHIDISNEEEEALLIAVLLHDIGHGPFSHAMESSIINHIGHEQLSLFFMEELNNQFKGRLALAIEIFKGKYPRSFMNQLISSQLDMDRIDYLKRDSFYTGVPEGNINSERLIMMLNVANNQLVVEEKGIYSVEKFIIARRLMYWQVYLHKTSLAAEQLLIKLLQRAKELIHQGKEIKTQTILSFFLKHNIAVENIDKEVLDAFSRLDDYDIISTMKEWQFHEDFVLSELSKRILYRNLLKIKVKKKPVSEAKIRKYRELVAKRYSISIEEASYFVFIGEMENWAYTINKQNINILSKTGKITDIVKASDQLNLKALSKPIIKYYFCYPKTNI